MIQESEDVPSLSVVIPTLHAMSGISPTLRSIQKGVLAGLVQDVVLTDGGSTDGVEEIADAIGANLVTVKPGRGRQLRAGAECARGSWLLFLHADTVLKDNWPNAVRQHMLKFPNSAACFRLRFQGGGLAAWFVASWANFRTRAFALPYGDQGLLVSRALYDGVGKYPEIPVMEDVAIIRRIGRRRLQLLPTEASTYPERYLQEGWMNRGARNLCCIVMYALGVSPTRIANFYFRRIPGERTSDS